MPDNTEQGLGDDVEFAEEINPDQKILLPNPKRLSFLMALVSELINNTVINGRLTPDEIRFVATLFKGAVDMWYPKGGK